jgi:hypothetical protein
MISIQFHCFFNDIDKLDKFLIQAKYIVATNSCYSFFFFFFFLTVIILYREHQFVCIRRKEKCCIYILFFLHGSEEKCIVSTHITGNTLNKNKNKKKRSEKMYPLVHCSL